MRRASALAALVFVALLTACPSPPKNGECKSSKDCEAPGRLREDLRLRPVRRVRRRHRLQGRLQSARPSKCEPKPARRWPWPRPSPSAPATPSAAAARAARTASASAPSTPPAPTPRPSPSHFGFDQATITGDSTSALQKLAGLPRQGPGPAGPGRRPLRRPRHHPVQPRPREEAGRGGEEVPGRPRRGRHHRDQHLRQGAAALPRGDRVLLGRGTGAPSSKVER